MSLGLRAYLEWPQIPGIWSMPEVCHSLFMRLIRDAPEWLETQALMAATAAWPPISMRLGLPPAPASPQSLLSLLAQESQVSVIPHTVISPPGRNLDLTGLSQGYACHAGG